VVETEAAVAGRGRGAPSCPLASATYGHSFRIIDKPAMLFWVCIIITYLVSSQLNSTELNWRVYTLSKTGLWRNTRQTDRQTDRRSSDELSVVERDMRWLMFVINDWRSSLCRPTTAAESVGDELPRAELERVVLGASLTGAVLSHRDLSVSRCARVWVGHVGRAVVTPRVVQLVTWRVLPQLARLRLDTVLGQHVRVVLYCQAQTSNTHTHTPPSQSNQSINQSIKAWQTKTRHGKNE